MSESPLFDSTDDDNTIGENNSLTFKIFQETKDLLEADWISSDGRSYVRARNAIYEKLLLREVGPLDRKSCDILAYGILELSDMEKDILHARLWTPEFIELVMDVIESKTLHWDFLLASIGNFTSDVENVIIPFMNCPTFIAFIKKHIFDKKGDPTTSRHFGCSLQTYVSWLITHIVSNIDISFLSREFLDLIPALLYHMEFATDSRPLSTRSSCFRALAHIFSISSNRTARNSEFQKFVNLVLTPDSPFIPSLLIEFHCGLVSEPVEGTLSYPSGYDRAFAFLSLVEIEEFRGLLLADTGLINSLVEGLFIFYSESEKETILLWSVLLHLFQRVFQLDKSRFLQYFQPNNPNRRTLLRRLHRTLRSLATGRQDAELMVPRLFPIKNYSILAGTSKAKFLNRQRIRWLAVDILIGSDLEWEIYRLLWIGQRKCTGTQHNCYLERLPSELIRMIMRWVLYLGANNIDKHDDTIEMNEIHFGYKYD